MKDSLRRTADLSPNDLEQLRLLTGAEQAEQGSI